MSENGNKILYLLVTFKSYNFISVWATSTLVETDVYIVPDTCFMMNQSCEEINCSWRSEEIDLGLIILMNLTLNVSILQEALSIHHNGSNKSETRVTLHYTLTHCTLVRLWGSSPVYLCCQTEEGRVDLWQWGREWKWNIWGLWRHDSSWNILSLSTCNKSNFLWKNMKLIKVKKYNIHRLLQQEPKSTQ